MTAYAPNIVETPIVTLGGAVTATEGSFDPDTYLMNVDPLLGPLADNGGPTLTHLPGVGSPAIDQGDNASANEITNPNYFGLPFAPGDQRNFQRIFNDTVDLGAVEVGGSQLPAAEADEFQHALLQVVVDFGTGPVPLTLDGSTTHVTIFDGPKLGDAVDNDESPDGLGEVGSFFYGTFQGFVSGIGFVEVEVHERTPAAGEIEETANTTAGTLDLPPFGSGTANSFFDVFFDVSVNGGSFSNQNAARLAGVVQEKPAGAGDMFVLQGGPVVLTGGPIALEPQRVPLRYATTTDEQTSSLTIDKSIDGVHTGAGWAIVTQDNKTHAQVAVFATVADLNVPTLTFTLDQLFGDSHTIGRFRLSVTADDRSTFADGLHVGGDVDANWTVLDPVSFESANGATLQKLDDHSLLASGYRPATDTYTITALSPIVGITGIRLEVLEDSSLSDSGPGRADNGNFVLTEFTVEATPVVTSIDVNAIKYTPIPLLDYGDAPEAGTYYQTTSTRDGARHVVVEGGPRLGANVDVEANGQPTVGANGDDTTGSPDDEDGVTILTPLVLGETATIRVNAPNGGVLNAWIDYQGYGFFSTQFIRDQVLVAGDNDLDVFLEFNPFVAANDTYVRFRINSTGGLSSGGLATDGEVEDYVVHVQSLDFGDAPDSYGTLLTSNGARHLRGGPMFGSSSDAELDGLPSADATLDDSIFSDDENGVFFTPLVTSFLSQVVVDASAAGFVNGWFDFNRDGDFMDDGEHIFNDVAVAAGLNPLTFTVPASLTEGVSFSRFRIASTAEGVNSPLGLAPDGEVEDYGLVIEGFDLPDPDDDPNPTNTTFVFTVLQPVRRWYDPAIAVGYDYVVTSGPNFKSVTLPILSGGDNLYMLYRDDPGGFVDTPTATLAGGVEYDFTAGFDDASENHFDGIAGGLPRFRILGIETAAAVDPADPEGFVTGLSFVAAGGMDDSFTMTGIPEKVYVDNAMEGQSIDEDGWAGDFFVQNDVDESGSLTNGDVVKWLGSAGSDDNVRGLIFGTTAFATVQSAINHVQNNDYRSLTTVQIAPGTFFEHLQMDGGGTLVGAGSGLTILDGSEDGRVLEVRGGNVANVSGVTIQNGRTDEAGGGGIVIANDGNHSTLIVSDSLVTGNTAANDYGGGIQNDLGTLTLINTTVSGNTATYDGGGVHNNGTLTITNSTISDNTSMTGSGGGIHNRGPLTITNSTINHNLANSNNGGGIWSNGVTEISSSRIRDNSAFHGAGLFNSGGTLTLTNSTIRDNSAGSDGGGLVSFSGTMTVTSSTISGNRSGLLGGAAAGGGIFNYSGSVTVANSTISGNSATSDGGGIYSSTRGLTSQVTLLNSTVSGNSAASDGGGIYNSALGDGSTSLVTVFNSTISGNTANDGGGIQSLRVEGGLSEVVVSNSTISGNSASNNGGGISNRGNLTVSSVTITGNRADSDGNDAGNGGGLFAYGYDTVNNSIVAGNFRGTGSTPNDIEGSGVVEIGNFNLIGDPNTRGGLVNGNHGNIIGQSDGDGGRELLDIHRVLDTTLRDNGGPTLTHRLVYGSPALDAGSNALILPDILDLNNNQVTDERITVDQRGIGFPRIIDGTVDIGAYEKGWTALREFPITLGKFVLEVPDPDHPAAMIQVTIFPQGPAQVAVEYVGLDTGSALDLDGDGHEEVLTELVSLNLVGHHPSLGTSQFPNLDGLEVRLDPTHASVGRSEETDGETANILEGPVDSFFDVFFQLEIRSTDLTLHQNDPVHIAAHLSDLIPAPGENFVSTGDPVPLFDEMNAPAGEIQQFCYTTAPMDFGDAPSAAQSGFAASYPTLAADDGARHLLTEFGPCLGHSIDGDFDGVPTAGAVGDDTADGTDDEDGIVFAPLMRVSSSGDRVGSVTVTYATPKLPPFLDAWIDFNHDGDWDDDGEHVFDGVNLQDVDGDEDGSVTLVFTIPKGAKAGTTYSRFRVSSQDVELPTGLAMDGEVEDHAVTFFSELVEVVVIGDKLRITDNGGQSNNITVTRDLRTKEYVVRSTTNDLTKDGTTPTNEVRYLIANVKGLCANMSSGNDRLDLRSLTLPTTVYGGEGNDTLLGGYGQDMLFGEGGNDSVRGGANHDTVSGGSGTDTVGGDAGTDIQLEETNAPEVFVYRNSIKGIGTDDDEEIFLAGTDKVHIIGGGGNNRIDASKSIRPVTLEGGNGNDTLIGSNLSDQLLGGAGEDSLNGQYGNDLLNGGTENDMLTGGFGNDTLTGGDGTDILVETYNTSFNLSNTSLIGLGTDTLAGLEDAHLTGGVNSNTFTVTSWTGMGTFVGGGAFDTLAVTKDGNFMLTDTSLVTSDGMNLTLAGFVRANLTGGVGNNVFEVSAWHGAGTIRGEGGLLDRIEVTRDTDLTLTNGTLASAAGSGFATLGLVGIETANLVGGASANKLIARAFTLGSVTLTGGGGNDVLIGGSGNDSLIGGAGRDLLIGGAGKDTLNGNADDDILIGGTSTHSSNLTALNAIMAEWGSLARDYDTRVTNLRDVGVGVGHSIKLKNTTVQNDAGAADSLNELVGAGADWFFKSANDVLAAIEGSEVMTTVP